MKDGGDSSLLTGPRKGDTRKIQGVHVSPMERDLGRRDQGHGEQIHIGKVERYFRRDQGKKKRDGMAIMRGRRGC